MGTSQSHPVFFALKELLQSKDIKIRKRNLLKFLEECDTIAPWFAVSGSLTLPSWDKLGRDLDFAQGQGELSAGIRPIWKMVRTCLENQKCSGALEAGRAALEQLKEERSESAHSMQGAEAKADAPLYPNLSDFESLGGGDSGSEEEAMEALKRLAVSTKGRDRSRKESESNFRHDRKESESNFRHDQKESESNFRHHRRKESESTFRRDPPVTPSAPPVSPPPYVKGQRSLHAETWRKAATEPSLACPVFLDANGAPYREILDLKLVKSLAESVRTYGIRAPFTIAQVEALARYAMTPTDWYNLARAALPGGSYLEWKAQFGEFAEQQGARNAQAGNPEWSREMLLAQGQFALQQAQYPQAVYDQINTLAIHAWKALPERGGGEEPLTRIIQGPTEQFSDFVARLLEAAERILGNPEAAMPLIKQLAFEQCTRECRAAIIPIKQKSLREWMKACRDLGGPLTNSGLAAAILHLNKKTSNLSAIQKGCFRCGKQGHLKRNCPENQNAVVTTGGLPPGLCPRCRKGRHWAGACRSIRDLEGRLLPSVQSPAQPQQPQQSQQQPKNGYQGPQPQGPPQMYGALEMSTSSGTWPSMSHQGKHGEPLQAQQDWTSVPPPNTY